MESLTNENWELPYRMYGDSFYKEAAGPYAGLSKNAFFHMLSARGAYDFFLVAKEKKLAAFCGFIKGFMVPDKHIAWISLIAVEQHLMRNGYGAEMFWAIAHYIKNDYKIVKIYITVKQDNATAISFWESMGFVAILALPDREASYLYEKIL